MLPLIYLINLFSMMKHLEIYPTGRITTLLVWISNSLFLEVTCNGKHAGKVKQMQRSLDNHVNLDLAMG